jgi:hypothetical protein
MVTNLAFVTWIDMGEAPVRTQKVERRLVIEIWRAETCGDFQLEAATTAEITET